VGVAVGVTLAVAVGVAVGVTLGVGVAVAVAVAVAVGVVLTLLIGFAVYNTLHKPPQGAQHNDISAQYGTIQLPLSQFLSTETTRSVSAAIRLGIASSSSDERTLAHPWGFLWLSLIEVAIVGR